MRRVPSASRGQGVWIAPFRSAPLRRTISHPSVDVRLAWGVGYQTPADPHATHLTERSESMAIERMPYDESIVAMGEDAVATFQVTRDTVYIDVFPSMEEARAADDSRVVSIYIPRHEWQRWIDGAPQL
jgi:hypothetical protein